MLTLLALFGCTIVSRGRSRRQGRGSERLAPFLLAAALALLAPRAEAGPTLVVEAESGKVLHAIDAFEPWYPASLTKMMTAYVVFRAIQSGRITMDTPVLVSQEAARQPPSKMGFPVGTGVTVDDALRMLFVKSANDIAVALAEGVSGSVAGFVEEMNQSAARLGMVNSRFANPHGLPDEGQWTTARDLAVLARALVVEQKRFAAFYNISGIRFGKRFMRNHNNLMGRYEGVDGLKTGYICASGFNVVATATRNGRQLIAVVLGAPRAARRAEIAASILEEGFATSFLQTLTAERLESMRPRGSVRARPIDLRPYICRPRKQKMPAEGLQMLAVDPRINLDIGRRALSGKDEGSDEGEAPSAPPEVAQTLSPAVATFAPVPRAREADPSPVTPALKIPLPTPRPARGPVEAAAAPKPRPERKPATQSGKAAAVKSDRRAPAKATAPKPVSRPAAAAEPESKGPETQSAVEPGGGAVAQGLAGVSAPAGVH